MLLTRRLTTLALGAVLSLGAATSVAEELKIALASVHTGIDPHYHNNGQNNSSARHVFESLTKISAKGRLEPGLAKSWRWLPDGTLEFDLREGVRFHDGTPLRASDVVFSFQRILDGVPNSPGAFNGFLQGVTGMEAVSDTRLHLKTDAPQPLLPLNLVNLYIVSEKHGKGAATNDYTTGKAMIGTGPYKFESWVPGVSLVFTRNDEYWGGAEPWEKVTLQIMSNEASRLASLLAGDTDVIAGVPTNDMERLKGEDGIRLWSSPTTRYTMLVPGFVQGPDSEHFSAKDGSPLKANPFHDIRVRKALSLAIDREVIRDRVNAGQAVIARQLMPEGLTGYIPEYDMTAYDLEEAKRLLAEAGYPDGFKLTVHTSNDRIVNAVRTVQVVGQMWSRLGLDVTIDTMPHSVFSKRRGALELPMYLSSWGNSLGDPAGVLVSPLMTYDKEKGQGAANRGRYSNPELDRLALESAVEVDDAKREALQQQALKIAYDDYAQIPLVWWVYTWGTRADLSYEPRLDQATLAMAVRPAN